MSTLCTLTVIIVALFHIIFFVLESLLWTTQKGREIFQNSIEAAETTKILAFNQGFYNLGLALLLFWFLYDQNNSGVIGVLIFLAAMGVVGGVSAAWNIIILQTVPALIALALVAFSIY